MFISVAYVVTHPNWRKDLKSYRRWKRNAKKRTLYPFARRIGLSRTTLLATREEDVWDFYVNKLGFRLKKQIVPLDASGTDFLLEMGRSQVEIRCSNQEEALPPQSLTISAKRIVTIKNGWRPMASRSVPLSRTCTPAPGCCAFPVRTECRSRCSKHDEPPDHRQNGEAAV